MDAIVTARVPVEIKEQVNAILKEMDATPTMLVNAAYEYVLSTHALPAVMLEYDGGVQRTESGKRIIVITKEMREELKRREERCTFPAPQSFWDELGDRDYKEIIAEGKLRDYEALG